MKLHAGSRVYVCDGGRFVAYEQRGDTMIPDLFCVESETFQNLPSHDLGDDRPGRYPSPDGQKSAVSETDLHELAESRFTAELVSRINSWCQLSARNKFILIADPRSMGRIRSRMTPTIREQMLQSITGDFVHHPVSEIMRVIAKA